MYGVDKVAALNHRAAALAREAADAAGREVLVAGSMGATGELVAPMGRLTDKSAEEELAEALRRETSPDAAPAADTTR